jgi:hypothetical protein
LKAHPTAATSAAARTRLQGFTVRSLPRTDERRAAVF